MYDEDDRSSGARNGTLRRDLLALLGLAGVGTVSSAVPNAAPGAAPDAASGAALGAAQATQGVPVKPTAQAVEWFTRLVADTSGMPSLSYAAGTVWGFRPQADDLALADFARRIYGYKSLVVRKARRLPDGHWAIRQQGWTFYADPVTDVITDTLLNPYTGLEVQPYSPPSMPFEVGYRPDGSTFIPGKEDVNPLGNGQSTVFDTPFDMHVRKLGAHSFINTSQVIRFKPANIDWYKLEATLISYACRTADLLNPKLTHIPSTWTMNLVAEWQTWMNMHGSPGHILFKGDGTAVDSIADVPADYRAALAAKFAGQLEKALAW